jgi:hypothetical protein
MTRIYRAGESPRIGAVLVWELDQNYCRGKGTLLAGDGNDRDVKIGHVLGRRHIGAVVAAALPGNTGNGTVTAAAATASTVAGVYHLVCTAIEEDGGRFALTAPDGVRLADAVVGDAYSGWLSFTIADGATDFAVGDGFTVTVAAGDAKYVALDPDATDGSQQAAAVSLAAALAPDGADAPFLVLERGPARLIASGLVWPDGITNEQKAAALTALADRQMLVS